VLEEMTGVKPDKDGTPRRWFADGDFDLFVWSRGGKLDGFELCYDKKGSERAVSWAEGKGWSRALIDQGEDNPSKNNSPIWLKDEGDFDARGLVVRFEQAAGKLDPAVYDFVRSKLASLP
jgi:hypothetical protein